MTVDLVLNSRAVKALINSLGPEKVTVLEPKDADGYSRISFEIKCSFDVLRVFHAGADSGLELGLYGLKGKPEEMTEDLVDLERG